MHPCAPPVRSPPPQGVLGAALRSQVEQAESQQRLEDLYLPHRPKRATKGVPASCGKLFR